MTTSADHYAWESVPHSMYPATHFMRGLAPDYNIWLLHVDRSVVAWVYVGADGLRYVDFEHAGGAPLPGAADALGTVPWVAVPLPLYEWQPAALAVLRLAGVI